MNVRPRDAEASLLHEDVVTLQGAHFADPAAGEGERDEELRNVRVHD